MQAREECCSGDKGAVPGGTSWHSLIAASCLCANAEKGRLVLRDDNTSLRFRGISHSTMPRAQLAWSAMRTRLSNPIV